jgi:hypothetical protein
MTIEAGDLVMVVKLKPCCGGGKLGYPFIVRTVRMSTPTIRCELCGAGNPGEMIAEYEEPYGLRVVALWRLKKIPPLSELEGKERERELVK